MKKLKTSIHKQGSCQRWGCPISVYGHYEYKMQDGKEATLCGYSCPIVNNMMLPQELKNKRYAEYQFCDCANTCELLKQFPSTVDVIRDGIVNVIPADGEKEG